ncbi:hypothetical protein HDV00_006133 [Rhizophlyctis rosea]|nr:hypothetical protein HDV00_006133 [Rhizophlyctis rosea]
MPRKRTKRSAKSPATVVKLPSVETIVPSFATQALSQFDVVTCIFEYLDHLNDIDRCRCVSRVWRAASGTHLKRWFRQHTSTLHLNFGSPLRNGSCQYIGFSTAYESYNSVTVTFAAGFHRGTPDLHPRFLVATPDQSPLVDHMRSSYHQTLTSIMKLREGEKLQTALEALMWKAVGKLPPEEVNKAGLKRIQEASTVLERVKLFTEVIPKETAAQILGTETGRSILEAQKKFALFQLDPWDQSGNMKLLTKVREFTGKVWSGLLQGYQYKTITPGLSEGYFRQYRQLGSRDLNRVIYHFLPTRGAEFGAARERWKGKVLAFRFHQGHEKGKPSFRIPCPSVEDPEDDRDVTNLVRTVHHTHPTRTTPKIEYEVDWAVVGGRSTCLAVHVKCGVGQWVQFIKAMSGYG